MILSQSVVSGHLGLFLDTAFKEKYKLTGLWTEEGKENAVLSCELCLLKLEIWGLPKTWLSLNTNKRHFRFSLLNDREYN